MKLNDRLDLLENLLDVVLQASLRGHLSAEERRLFKKHLASRKKIPLESDKAEIPEDGPVCPACHLPLGAGRVRKRCPHCSVLLAEARKARS